MVIFRENTEDIYAGIEFQGGKPEAQKVLDFIKKEFPRDFEKIRFSSKDRSDAWSKESGNPAPETETVGIGIKAVSWSGTVRLVFAAAEKKYGDKVYTWGQWDLTKAAKGAANEEVEQKSAQLHGAVVVKDAIIAKM